MRQLSHMAGYPTATVVRPLTWCIICVLLILAASAFSQTVPESQEAQQLLSLINQERTRAGVAPLELNAHLTDAAPKHSQRMAQADTLQHQFDGEPALTL